MDFEQVGRDHLRLGADLAAGHCRGRAGDRCRARAVGAEPIGCGIGVALLDGDVLGRDADLARQDLRKGRGVALALADRAEPRNRAPRRVDANLARIEHAEAKDVAILDRAGADDLCEKADADPHQFSGFATSKGLAIAPLLLTQARVVYCFESLVERRQVVAAVIFPSQGRAVGKLLLLIRLRRRISAGSMSSLRARTSI